MQAWAADGSYSIDELSTQITVETNATAHIVERQTLTFDDKNKGVTWYLHVPEDGESVRIASVRVAPVDDGGTLLGDWTRLQMVDSNPAKQGRNPGDTATPQLRENGVQPWFSYNIGDGMMRCYFPTGKSATITDAANATDEDAAADASAAAASDFHTYVIETDYTIAHRVRVYRDVAELYWRYVNDSLPVGPENVTLQVTLPLPADTDPAEASTQIRAWGHGPSDGTFAVGEDGSITYRIEKVAQGDYAEAHIIFPASWMSNMAGTQNQFSWLRGPAAIDEESSWVDIGIREAAWDNKVRTLFLGFALIVILVAAIGVARHGRSPRSRLALIRAAATLAILALAAQLFFRESLTVQILIVLAVAVGAISLTLPTTEEPEEAEEVEEEYEGENDSEAEELDEPAEEPELEEDADSSKSPEEPLDEPDEPNEETPEQEPES